MNKNKKTSLLKLSDLNDKTGHQKAESTDSRRSFLKKLWGVLGIVAGAEVIAAFADFFVSGKRDEGTALQNLVLAGNVTDFKMDSVFPFRSGKFYLVRFNDGGFMAISLKCTHLGCSVIWNDEKKEFICPCHASSFDRVGEVINPPAPRALDIFPVIIQEGKVKVDVAHEQRRKKFDKSQITYA